MDRLDITPPVARRAPTRLEKHGHVRIDDYYWLNNRDDPEVIAYLEAENAYTQAVMAHTERLQDMLFAEIKGRIKQSDVSAPYKKGDYFYYTRLEDGQEYPIYCRKKGSLDAPEEVMLDVNVLAQGHDFFHVGLFAISSGQNLVAYPVDTAGRRFFTIRIKNLDTGELLADLIPKVTDHLAWAEDNKTLFYVRQDPTTLREYQVYRHILGADPGQDQLVYEEEDDTFSCSVFKTKSERYIIIASEQTLASEYRYLEADRPLDEFRVFLPRESRHEYSIDHYGDHFYIRTNDGARNFRLMRTPIDRTAKRHWQVVVPHRDDVLLEGFEIFQAYLVVIERKQGLIQMCVRPWSGQAAHYIEFGEPAYWAYASDNYDFETSVLRYTYTSLTTPKSVFDYNMVTHAKVLLKQEEVLGGFDADHYQTERLTAVAGDGVEVPISIVYRKGIERDGGNPLLLYGYGSYGYSMDATFQAERISLLDRGFVYAIAHVRGGEEMGRWWYEDGKLLKKKNTFTDLIACAEYLV